MRECPALELEALYHDHNFYLRATLDCDGNVVFNISATKDNKEIKNVKEGKHNNQLARSMGQSRKNYMFKIVFKFGAGGPRKKWFGKGKEAKELGASWSVVVVKLCRSHKWQLNLGKVKNLQQDGRFSDEKSPCLRVWRRVGQKDSQHWMAQHARKSFFIAAVDSGVL
eukprot:4377493-Ditylum_brightwellii.AAC.1